MRKTPRRADVPLPPLPPLPRVRLVPPDDELWLSREQKLASNLQELAADVSAQFLQLGRIPDSDAERYTEWMPLTLHEWLMDVMWAKQSSENRLHDLLPDVKHKAVALGRQLEDVRRLLWEAVARVGARFNGPHTTDPSACWYELYVCTNLDLAVADPTLEALGSLISALDRVTSRRPGRSHGAKAFPGLSELVSQLEFCAQCCNGRFTFNKRHGKGTLIEAFNWLRAYCLSESTWKWLAPYLPPPNRHPLAVYETAMRAGRIDARLELARISRGGPLGTARLALQRRPTTLLAKLVEIDGWPDRSSDSGPAHGPG
jgi:hypothetical protein